MTCHYNNRGVYKVFATAMTASLKPFRGLPLLIFPGFIYAFMATSPHNSLGGMPITAATLSVSVIHTEDLYYPDSKYNDTYTLNIDELYFIHMRTSTGVAFVSGCILVSVFLAHIKLSEVLIHSILLLDCIWFTQIGLPVGDPLTHGD